MKLSIDSVASHPSGLVLTAGFDQSVKVIDLQSPDSAVLSSFKTSDNVSCVKTIYSKTHSKLATIFGTYDGRISYKFL